jgi:hypothetical protein
MKQNNGDKEAELAFHSTEGLVVHSHNNGGKQAEVYNYL